MRADREQLARDLIAAQTQQCSGKRLAACTAARAAQPPGGADDETGVCSTITTAISEL